MDHRHGTGMIPAVSALQILAILAAGFAAGTINSVVGSGTLITFPVILAFGYAPVVANVSNNVGLVPGNAASVLGYRRELEGQRSRVIRLAPMTFIGSVVGSVALLVLPSSAFKAIVPVFIVIALVLIVAQPRLGARLAKRQATHGGRHPWLEPGIFATGIYGGYFGAAQGILLLALLGLGLPDDLQRVNALKNVLATIANLTAAVIFVFAAHVNWGVAACIAGGSSVGASFGAHYGRDLPPAALRALIVAVGITAIVRLLV